MRTRQHAHIQNTFHASQKPCHNTVTRLHTSPHPPTPAALQLAHATYCTTSPPAVLLHHSLRTALLHWLLLESDSLLLTQPHRPEWQSAVDVLCALLQLPAADWGAVPEQERLWSLQVEAEWCAAAAVDVHAEHALRVNIPGVVAWWVMQYTRGLVQWMHRRGLLIAADPWMFVFLLENECGTMWASH